MQYIRNPDSIIFVPFETVTVIVRRFTNIQLNAQTIWNWVQVWGLQAMTHIQEEMAQLALGHKPTPETISSTLANRLAANKESPPREKKLSSIPMRSRFKVWVQGYGGNEGYKVKP